MLGTKLHRWVQKVQRRHYEFLGIGATARTSKALNCLFFRRRLYERYQSLYREHFLQFLQENDADFQGPLPRNLLRDGWAIDESRSLPHLDALLEQADQIIARRGGQDRRNTLNAQQPWFFSIFEAGDLEHYPAFLDFATSSEMLATVGHHLGCIPTLSKTRPPGVRFMESNARYDPNPDAPPRESQMYHLDLHDSPIVYVLVLVRDTTLESGPWDFLPLSTSQRAARLMRYQSRGVPYRVPDEEMYRWVDRSEVKTFAYPRGTVLFIDSSQCFHYGSRKSFVPRYQVMYAYTSPARTDLTELYLKWQKHPVGDSDSRLRRLVLRG